MNINFCGDWAMELQNLCPPNAFQKIYTKLVHNFFENIQMPYLKAYLSEPLKRNEDESPG